ncbi:MAG: hypothetical protein HY010_07665 [Acidobacteria bacterium]|nr:hypothetical protein [Acidobacteriota bacterium]
MTLRRLLSVVFAGVVSCTVPELHAQTIATFDVPGAEGTFPQAINRDGQVAGYYRDNVFQNHGFVRDASGILVTFDVPGSINTTPVAIDQDGHITGSYGDSVADHGFLRQPDGNILLFDAPGSSGTYPRGISPGGLITGYYYDDFGIHGFLRAKNGNVIPFDAPGTFPITFPQAINRKGQIAGWNIDQPGASGRGFVREVDGTFTRSFDSETYAVAINAEGEVSGYTGNNAIRGFLSEPDGNEVIFDVVNSTISATPVAIDHSGRVAGWYYDDQTGAVNGFIRKRDGTFVKFSVSPSAETFPTAMFGSRITGDYDDENGTHGFVRDSQNTDVH